jgi:carbonic anhydrase
MHRYAIVDGDRSHPPCERNMHPLKPLLIRLAMGGLLLTALTAQAQHAHWSYGQGHEGPVHWAEIDPAFETCGAGRDQSPIDIRRAVRADLPALQFGYTTATPTLVNNGHTIQVNLPPGQTLTVGDRQYELLQFHFHTPSEDALNGRRAPMEAHFVHRDASGHLGVVALMLQPGKAQTALAPLFAHLPRVGETITVDGLQIDLAALLPRDRAYYSFAGSLTTPPCSEGVSWMVLRQPGTVSAQQLRAFHRLYQANARPIQPLHDRVVQTSG